MIDDTALMVRAIELALLAEQEGNLPVGSLITLEGKIVSEGRSRIYLPRYDLTRHAEMEAIRALPPEYWKDPLKLSIYTTLEPCLMCLGAILLHGIGRVVIGTGDHHGGAEVIREKLPPFFKARFEATEWINHLMPEECDPLHQRLLIIEGER